MQRGYCFRFVSRELGYQRLQSQAVMLWASLKRKALYNNGLNSCPTKSRVQGWDAMKPLYWRSVNSKDAGRPRLSHQHRDKWNKTKWMAWRNVGMKFVIGENRINSEKNLPRPRFAHREAHTEWPRRELRPQEVGGERLTACAMGSLSVTWCMQN